MSETIVRNQAEPAQEGVVLGDGPFPNTLRVACAAGIRRDDARARYEDAS